MGAIRASSFAHTQTTLVGHTNQLLAYLKTDVTHLYLIRVPTTKQLHLHCWRLDSSDRIPV